MKIGVWAPRYAFTQKSAGLKVDIDLFRFACNHYGYDFDICNTKSYDFDVVFMMEKIAPISLLEKGKKKGIIFVWCINTELLSMFSPKLFEKIKLVDYCAGKTQGQTEYIKSLNWPSTTILLNFATPTPDIPESDEHRNAIIHFAGCSWYKNSVIQLKAGKRLVEEGHFEKMYLKLSGHRQDVQGIIERLKKIAGDDKRLVVLDEYLSEEEKNRIYAESRLALCASSREGFGHYILEAAAHGCQVVTTDGIPMRELLEEQVYLAKAERKIPKQEDLIWGYRYDCDENSIYNAAINAISDDYSIEKAKQNVENRMKLFLSDFDRFIEMIKPDIRKSEMTSWEVF